MKILAVIHTLAAAGLCLTLACATAGAEPQPAAPSRRPPPAKGCVARGTPIFELDHAHEPAAKLTSSSFRIYASGAWIFDTKDADDKAGLPMRGCFAGADLDAIRTDLKVPWKTTTAEIHCMAVSPAFTVYKVNGKTVYTQKLCSGVSLDEASEKARADLEARANAVTATAPACAATGTPKIVIAHKADGAPKLPTSTFSIFDSGAWTYTASNAVAQNGCFTGADLEAVKKDEAVPWKTTTAKMHCMAYSAEYTEVSVDGKLVYTQRLCNGVSLDAASQAALTDLQGRAPKTQP